MSAFPGWRVTLCGGALLLLLAITFVVPWQPGYVDAIPYCIGLGLGLAAAGLALVRAGLGLRGWPAGSAIAPHLVHARSGGAGLQLPPVPPTPPGHQPLIVRVWTALGTADHAVVHHHALLDRYIAAVDGQGTISTGHCAWSCRPTSISATIREWRSTTRQPSSACSAPRRTMTCRGASSPAMRSNRPNGARLLLPPKDRTRSPGLIGR